MRQFLADSPLDSKGCLTVEGKNFHYLSNVLRLVPGDMIDVRLKNGLLQQMTVALIDQVNKKIILQAAGSVVNENKNSSENKLIELWLFQFVAKPAKMELIVRQAVECGVSVIVPVNSRFSQSGAVKSAKEAALNFGKNGRWDRIIQEARQQSGSAVDTKVYDCITVQEAADLWKNISEEEKSLGVVLYEQTAGTKALHSAAGNAESVKRAAVAVGSEGGISPEELDVLQKAGFIPVHFATNILRCETAALYGCAALQTVLMEAELWQSRE